MPKILVILFVFLLAGCGWRMAKNAADTTSGGPAERIICLSSSHVAFLEELGVADRIVATWEDVGYDQNLDYERIAALRPDLILLYGAVPQRLAEMEVRCEVIEEYLEPTPLDRARWIVRVGELCGMRQIGEERFAEIERAYNEVLARTEKLVKTTGIRPRVMLNAPYRDVWFVPAADNFMVRFVEDAGGQCAFEAPEGSASRPIDIEQAWLAMQGADVWLNVNQYSSLAALLADNQRFTNTPPVAGGRVFNSNTDFWSSGVVRPDLVLQDLVSILYGTGEELRYYKKLD